MPRSKKFSKCNLSYYIKQNDLRLQDLADEFGVSYQQIQKYKSGANEMPLMILIGMCKKFNCNPQDLYPEIEAYYSGISIPKTTNEEPKDEDIQSSEVHHHHYYPPANYRLIDKLFNTIKVMDINEKGSALIKGAFMLLSTYVIAYYVLRVFGFHLKDAFTQAIVSLNFFDIILGLTAPIVVRHPLMYALSFNGFADIVADFDYIAHLLPFNTMVFDSLHIWEVIIAAGVMTFIYSLFVKKLFVDQKK